MDSEGLGPNAGLLFAMSYFVNHHTNSFLDWLGESYESDFQYIFCDLPGQVEIFSHLATMRKFKDILETRGYRIISLYLVFFFLSFALLYLPILSHVDGCPFYFGTNEMCFFYSHVPFLSIASWMHSTLCTHEVWLAIGRTCYRSVSGHTLLPSATRLRSVQKWSRRRTRKRWLLFLFDTSHAKKSRWRREFSFSSPTWISKNDC